MKYGERLKTARLHAKLTQAELAQKAKIGTQENVSKLERKEAEGSEFTVHYAIACGVRPEWLALEAGEMVTSDYTQDPRLTTALAVMQKLPEYAIDRAIKELDSIVELVNAAKAEGAAHRDNSSAANPAGLKLGRRGGGRA